LGEGKARHQTLTTKTNAELCLSPINLFNREDRLASRGVDWRKNRLSPYEVLIACFRSPYGFLPKIKNSMDALLQVVGKFLVVLFLVGVVGSLVVVALSFVEDVDLLFERNEPSSVDAAQPRA
jgi:hypothetical protein